jgi:hypothetical protein
MCSLQRATPFAKTRSDRAHLYVRGVRIVTITATYSHCSNSNQDADASPEAAGSHDRVIGF